MSTLTMEREGTRTGGSAVSPSATSDRYVRHAYWALRLGFIAAPILAGADKFFDLMVNWTQYLTPLVPRLTGLAPATFMKGVGVVEIVAGILVAVKPKIGAYVVSAWLVGIIVNLLTIPGFFDVALRDLGLALGAFSLGRLSQVYDR